MRVVVQDTLRNRQWLAYEGRAGFRIGRGEECEVRLEDGRFVSRRHLVVDRVQGGWELRVEVGATPVSVDDAELAPGRNVLLKPVSHVSMVGFVLTLMQDVQDASQTPETRLVEDLNHLQRDIHTAVLDRLELRRGRDQQLAPNEQTLASVGSIIDDVLQGSFGEKLAPGSPARLRLLALALGGRMLQWVNRRRGGDGKESRGTYEIASLNVALESLCEEYYTSLAGRLGLEPGVSDDRLMRLDEDLLGIVPRLAMEMPENVQVYVIARHVKKVICDMIFGLGPLQDLLDMPTVSEIMIVSPTQVYIEQGGRILESNRTFLGDEALLSVIERIVAPLGRRIDRSTPLVDARLADGSRVNAIVPPLALKGPCLTIRRFPADRMTAPKLLQLGSITEQAVELLRGAVAGKRNVVVAGGTGSGKTTLLNVLSAFIGPAERLVTIEDSAELQLQQKHVVSLETRPPNVEGKGEYTIRDLLRNALRMRPDRIIVGECRGAEAFDMLQAMNTGHRGSLTTVHANSAQDAVLRLESMCLQAVEIPIAAIRRQIAQALDLIVYIERLSDRSRMVTSIVEVVGLHPKSGEVLCREIMKAHPRGGKMVLDHFGYIPSFLGELSRQGLIDVSRLFSVSQGGTA